MKINFVSADTALDTQDLRAVHVDVLQGQVWLSDGQTFGCSVDTANQLLGLLKESIAPKPYSDANPHPASCYIATNQLKAEREAAKQSG